MAENPTNMVKDINFQIQEYQKKNPNSVNIKKLMPKAIINEFLKTANKEKNFVSNQRETIRDSMGKNS